MFAPDPHFDPGARALIREYNRYSKNRAFGAFGPATYMAGLAAATAIYEGLRGRSGDAGRSDSGDSAHEHPVDLRRQAPILCKG